MNGCGREEKDCGREKILEQKIGMRQKAKTLLKGMGLQASRPGTRIEGSRIPKILEKQLMLQSLMMIIEKR